MLTNKGDGMTRQRQTGGQAVAMMLVAGLGAAVTAQPAATPAPQASARGIYVGGAQLGINAEVEIERDGQRGMVPTSFQFKSGDKFWLHVTVNRDSYVYVLNRTLPGAAASRGIKLIAEQDRTGKEPPPSDVYSLVFPAPKSGPQLVRKGVDNIVPSGRGQFFAMDENPGAELVMVMASETPVKMSDYFDLSSGRLRPFGGGGQRDSVGDVLNRLNGLLVDASDNAETDEPPASRDIRIVTVEKNTAVPPEDGGIVGPARASAKAAKPVAPALSASSTVCVAKKPGKPMLLPLRLTHLAR
jgi:hypothetical protein